MQLSHENLLKVLSNTIYNKNKYILIIYIPFSEFLWNLLLNCNQQDVYFKQIS